MKRIVITCAKPGFRRAGIEHPARKLYEPGELTAEQLDAIRAEPNLTVVELREGAADSFSDRPAVALRGAIVGAIAVGISREVFLADATTFITRQWDSLQPPSGGDHNSEAPQQAQDASGQQAEPEAELADKVGEEAAQESTSGVTPGLSAPETGEAEGDGAAAAAPAADKPAKPARKPK